MLSVLVCNSISFCCFFWFDDIDCFDCFDLLIRKTKIIVKIMIKMTIINPIIKPIINPIEIVVAEEFLFPFEFEIPLGLVFGFELAVVGELVEVTNGSGKLYAGVFFQQRIPKLCNLRVSIPKGPLYLL